MNPVRITILVIGLLGLVNACSLGHSGWDTHTYRVREGDTLYAIAWRYQLDFQQLAEWNNIDPPYTIYPGQRLVLADSGRLSSVEHSSKSSAESTGNNRSRRNTNKTVAAEPPAQFQWPVTGKVIRRFDGRKSGSQGIDIAGDPGQVVVASAPGRVVYSGSGLVGYGKLVIVKHNEDYLSAYAYNSKLRVKEGDRVEGGDVIAEMGLGANNSPSLHFEIRKQGRPVDPLGYLPER